MGGFGYSDVATPSFWVFVAIAVVVLGLASRTLVYGYLLALFNLGFCALIVGWRAAGAIALALACLHLVCHLRSSTARTLGVTAAGLLLSAGFLLHKLPMTPDGATGQIKVVLAGIGFSYIALRGIEYLRAVLEGSNKGAGLPDTVNYLVPFHMLTAGPIMAYADFRRQPLPAAALDRDGVLEAVERIARGLFKKFVLANGLIETVFLTGFKADGPYFLLEVQFYYLFIYLDFSAYTDIAIGIGRLLGVPTPENFNWPLGARNIIAFWERWHISLSQFIRRNLFIPIQLAGMRWTHGRWQIWVASAAYLVAFVLCGLWHGISWRFLLWGALHACALIICNIYRHLLVARLGHAEVAAYMERPLVRMASTVITFEFVAFSLALIAHPSTAFLG
jgi:alginate O-acetyltransferase complex protein AlgI